MKTINDMMDITEEIITRLCKKVNGTLQKINYQGTNIDLETPLEEGYYDRCNKKNKQELTSKQ